jgi:hypothetical protein
MAKRREAFTRRSALKGHGYAAKDHRPQATPLSRYSPGPRKAVPPCRAQANVLFLLTEHIYNAQTKNMGELSQC